jgi:hypothetical protein
MHFPPDTGKMDDTVSGVQRSELLAACAVGVAAAILYLFGDASLLESVAGVALLAGIVLVWFWGWRRYYESNWPQRMSTSALRYSRVPLWALLWGGGAAFLAEIVGFEQTVQTVVGLVVTALVALLEAGAVRDELRVSRSQPSGR